MPSQTAPNPALGATAAPSHDDKDDHTDDHTSVQAPIEKTVADSDQSSDEKGEWLTGLPLLMVFVPITLATVLMLLDTTVISTAIPKITDEFHSLDDVGWYGSAYSLGSAALQPMTGKVYRHFSLKWSFLAFFLVFEVGSALCGAATSSPMFIIGRAIAGIGASGIVSGSITMISACVPLARRPPLTGACIGISQLGAIAGPIVGGAFTTGATWRWSFYINLPIGALVAVPIAIIHIPEQIEKRPAREMLRALHRHLDLVGFALFAPAVIQLLLALQYGGNKFPWGSATVIGLFCGSFATFVVWAVWNWRQKDDALIPVSIVRRKVVISSALNYGMCMVVVFGGSYYLPLWFQAVKDTSAVMSGVYRLPTILPVLVATVASGILVTKIGRVPPIAMVASALSAIGSGLTALLRPDSGPGPWVGFQVITGVGLGAGFQMPITAVQHDTAPSQLAEAMAFLVWAQYMGPTIFMVLFNTILTTSLGPQLSEHAPNVDAGAIIAAGGTGFRAFVGEQDLPGVVLAFSNSLDRVFYLVAGAGALGFVAAFGMGWGDIREKKKTGQGENDAQSEGIATAV